jgi:predicted GNAT family acetyltransferase
VDLNLEGVTITNNEEAQRFEAQVDGLRALLTYRRFPGRIVLNHTEVPPPLEGKGLAAKLARAALDFARASQLRVVSLCPYVSAFLRKHPEYHDLVSADDLQKLLCRSSGTTGR